MVVIKMIQIRGELIVSPFKLPFETVSKEKKFLEIWKLSNVVLAHKKKKKKKN